MLFLFSIWIPNDNKLPLSNSLLIKAMLSWYFSFSKIGTPFNGSKNAHGVIANPSFESPQKE